MPEGLMGLEISRSVTTIPGISETPLTLLTTSSSPTINASRSSFGSVLVVTNTTPSDFTAYGSEDGATWTQIYSEGVAVTITAPTAGWHELPSACLSVPFLQFRIASGTATIRVYLKG